MSEIEHFIEVFALASEQAGSLARRLQGEISLHPKKKEEMHENEVLTSVDLAAQDIILVSLFSEFPNCSLDAEEETETARLFHPFSPEKPLIVLDPIDGTRNYGRGSQEYAIMASWIEKDMYQASFIHFPGLRMTFWAKRRGGCWKRKDNRNESVAIGSLSRRVRVTRDVPEYHRLTLKEIGYDVIESRCSALDSAAPAVGNSAASISMGRPTRRRAVGFLLTLEAGGVVRIGDRWWKGDDPLGYPPDHRPTVVAENQETADRIMKALTGRAAGAEAKAVEAMDNEYC